MPQEQHLARILDVLASQGTSIRPTKNNAFDWSPDVSWQRCLHTHCLEPLAPPTLVNLTQRELSEALQEFGEQNVDFFKREIRRVAELVEPAGYTACIANSQGVVIAQYAPDSVADHYAADRLGTLWKEELVGTNGIGTCIVEGRAISVFRESHFHADLTEYSCVALPLHDANANLLAVLNLATRNPDVNELTHGLVCRLASISAIRLEKHLFQQQFPRERIVSFSRGNESSFLALRDDGLIMGASQGAQAHFRLKATHDGWGSLWEYFERADEPFSNGGSATSVVSLRSLSTGQLITAQVSQPVKEATRQSSGPASQSRGRQERQKAPVVTIHDWAGHDRSMRKSVAVLEKLSGSGLPVLLLGETGVGKDTLANAIHLQSTRAQGPFVAVNCAAIPETLIDSELFGYQRGAFTGANREGNVGRFVEANGGTIFLDEIGDMPLSLQTRLLRVLESGEVSPLGAGRSRPIDVQVVAATNQNLQNKVASGEFREDLYFRLAGVVIDIPALRDRDDQEQIFHSMLDRCSDGQTYVFGPRVVDAMLDYEWPGNVRELKTVLQRAVKLCNDNSITIEDLMLRSWRSTNSYCPPYAKPSLATAPNRTNFETAEPLKSTVADVERIAIIAALQRYDRNIDEAARSLAMSRATLYRKLKRHCIDVEGASGSGPSTTTTTPSNQKDVSLSDN